MDKLQARYIEPVEEEFLSIASIARDISYEMDPESVRHYFEENIREFLGSEHLNCDYVLRELDNRYNALSPEMSVCYEEVYHMSVGGLLISLFLEELRQKKEDEE